MAAAAAALGRTISFAPASAGGPKLAKPLPPRPPPLAALLGLGFEVCVADPRHCDIFSQSSTFTAQTHTHMREDVVRTQAFGAAIKAHCSGKVVLDVGTGDAAVFALKAARAGAAHVFAVEGDPASAARSRAVVEAAEQRGELRRGLVTVVCCLSTELSLAEHLGGVTPEVVVHELLGHFAGSEGVGYFYDDLRRRVCPNALSIPHCARTMLAPGRQPSPELLRSAPAARTLIGPGQKYLAVGPQLPPELLLAQPQAGEDLLFNDGGAAGVAVVQGELLEFEVEDATQVEGFYAWLRFQTSGGGDGDGDGGGEGGWTDALQSDRGMSWQVFFLPWSPPPGPASATVPPVVSGLRKRRRSTSTNTTATVHARLHANSLDRAPEYRFEFGAGTGGEEHSTTISLGELYPLTGGDYCRHCGEMTASLLDQESRFKACAKCNAAYHKACVVKLGWEGLTCGWWSADGWLCGGCRPAEA